MPREHKSRHGKGHEGGSSRNTSHGQSSSAPTQWSEWILDPEGRGWYCWRTGINGQTEYNYAQTNTNNNTNNNDPRSPASIDDLSSTLSNTTISSNDSQPSSSSTGGTYGLYSSSSSSSAYPSISPTLGTFTDGNTYSPSNFNYQTSANSHPASTSSTSNPNYAQGGYQNLSSGRGGYDYSSPKSSQSTPTGSYAGPSSGTIYSGSSTFQPQTGYQPPYQQYKQQNYQQAQQGGQGSTTRAPPNPKHGGKLEAASQSPLDLQGFGIQKSHYFKPGHVFKVLWSEPMGQNTSGQTEVTQDEVEDTSGGKVHTTIRRFIIVASVKGHSQCVPILTYGRRGLTKPGVEYDEHAIIYTEYPENVDGENPIGKNAVRMVPKTPQDKLNNASRVNFAKIYTVEHNLRVKFIGQIAKECQKQFSHDFEEQWEKKVRFE